MATGDSSVKNVFLIGLNTVNILILVQYKTNLLPQSLGHTAHGHKTLTTAQGFL